VTLGGLVHLTSLDLWEARKEENRAQERKEKAKSIMTTMPTLYSHIDRGCYIPAKQ